MTATTANTNGRTRNSLASQIDRLDNILDGLADALNDAVATTVKEAVGIAVRESVQAVLTEVLTNPELQARLQPQPQTATEPAKPQVTFRSRLAAWGKNMVNGCKGACQAVVRGCRQIFQKTVATCKRVVTTICTYLSRLRMLAPFRWQIATALAAGIAVGAGAYHATPWIAALLSGVGAFVTAGAVHAALWLRRALQAPWLTSGSLNA